MIAGGWSPMRKFLVSPITPETTTQPKFPYRQSLVNYQGFSRATRPIWD
jgi:hypothetical protein